MTAQVRRHLGFLAQRKEGTLHATLHEGMVPGETSSLHFLQHCRQDFTLAQGQATPTQVLGVVVVTRDALAKGVVWEEREMVIDNEGMDKFSKDEDVGVLFQNITIVAHLNAFHAQGLGKQAAWGGGKIKIILIER